MYLSRIELNPYRRNTIKALNSPQIIHAAIMASFDSFGKPMSERILWRIDKVNSITYLLVQSQTSPDFNHIIDQFGRPHTNHSWDCLNYDEYLSKIKDGQTWRFRLKANPTYRVCTHNGDGKIYSHVTPDQQTKWLLDRSVKNGFSIGYKDEYPLLEIKDNARYRFQRNGKFVTIDAATFEGILNVDDAEVFKRSIINGIGRAKGYGCGMMTIIKH